MRPSYLDLHARGELADRVRQAEAILEDCTLCPRLCHVNRLVSADGICRSGALPAVAACHPHFGEERPLVGRGGSGTIFFSSCNLRCAFCQNWTISHMAEGHEVTSRHLAAMMVELEAVGCHNINLVTQTHMVPQILAALPYAIEMGLSLPLVYNTSGYERVETLRLLDGIVDIYMPDVKWMDPQAAVRYAAAADYPEVVRAAVREMHRQVGDLALDDRGIAARGLLVRHLVMPGQARSTADVMAFLAREISPDTYVNVMDQYGPCADAYRFVEIARPVMADEFDEALLAARTAGLRRLDADVGRRFPDGARGRDRAATGS